MPAAAAHGSGGEPADEAGDETAAADRLGRGKAGKRQGQHWQLPPGLVIPAVQVREPHRVDTQKRQRNAHQAADADLRAEMAQHQLRGADAMVGLGGDGQQDQKNRDADAVVQAALGVQAFADGCRHRRVGGHGLTQGCIRGCKHGGQDGELDQAQAGQQQGTGHDARGYRQRQPNEQQLHRRGHVLPENPEIGAGGIGEQDQRQRQLGQGAQGPRIYLHPEQAQAERTAEDAEAGEDNGTCDWRPLQAPGAYAVDEHESEQDRDVLVHACCPVDG